LNTKLISNSSSTSNTFFTFLSFLILTLEPSTCQETVLIDLSSKVAYGRTSSSSIKCHTASLSDKKVAVTHMRK
jgi:hypothetical protein